MFVKHRASRAFGHVARFLEGVKATCTVLPVGQHASQRPASAIVELPELCQRAASALTLWLMRQINARARPDAKSLLRDRQDPQCSAFYDNLARQFIGRALPR